MSSQDAVLAQAMKSPRAERAEIAKDLLASLDEPRAVEDVEAAWLAEVERRLLNVDRSVATLESWDTVRGRIASRLRAKRT